MIKTNITDFLDSFDKDVKELQDEQQRSAKSIALTALSKVQELSPVDKGLFRASHTLSINRRENRTPNEIMDAQSSDERYAAIAQSNSVAASAALAGTRLKNGDKIYIQNHLEYAEAIENGHGGRRPGAVYARAIEIIRGAL